MQLSEREGIELDKDQQYIIFKLNEEEYAINALKVQEIVEMGNVTRVPQLPEFFRFRLLQIR